MKETMFKGYFVDLNGFIYSNRVKGIRKLKPNKTKAGYYKVVLRVDNKSKTVDVHRLVALTYVPNPNNYPVINHKDSNKLNNSVYNLEWCTQAYNHELAYKYNLSPIGDKHKSTKITDAMLIGMIFEKLNTNKSMAQISREHNCSSDYLGRVFQKRARKYIWDKISIEGATTNCTVENELP